MLERARRPVVILKMVVQVDILRKLSLSVDLKERVDFAMWLPSARVFQCGEPTSVRTLSVHLTCMRTSRKALWPGKVNKWKSRG